jgi:sugar phosphate isomerase/epimerase
MRLSVITDEISNNLDHALDVCESMGVRTVELRVVGDTNVVSHDEESLARVKALLDRRGIDVCAIAAPLFKCHLHGDGAPRGDTHSAVPASREEQWDLLERSFEVARLMGTDLVRAFSFWRVPDPREVREEVAAALAEAAGRAEEAGIRLALENEHECNVGTGEEAGWMLARIPSPAFGTIWDPGNEACMGSSPYPEGYRRVRGRVFHVHLKDVDAGGEWTKVGAGVIDYPGQLRELAESGYAGALSLETHYAIPDGGAEGATRESVEALRALCDEAGVELEA